MLRLKQLPEDFFPFFGGGKQKFQKISLCDHRDLEKLAAVDPEDLLDLSIHFFWSGEDRPVRKRKLGIGFLRSHPLPACFRAEIFGITPHGVLPVKAGESKDHFGGGVFRGIFGAEHGRLPLASACFPVKRIGDGVKNCCLSGAGIAGDQIKSACSELIQIQYDPVSVRSESRDSQLIWSHTSSSQIVSISPFKNVACSSFNG